MLKELNNADIMASCYATDTTQEPLAEKESNVSLRNQKAFLSLVEPGEYFRGGHWGECLELLAHLSQYSEQILVLTGPSGVGKSTLKQALIEYAASLFRLLPLEADPAWDVVTLMRRMAQGFGLDWEEGREMDIWEVPGHSSRQRVSYGQTWVLLIDNAHLLSEEVLKSLFNLSHEGVGVERQLHLLLIGEKGFDKYLKTISLSNETRNRLHHITLEVLTLPETESYLCHRWRIAGNNDPLPMGMDVIKEIYARSGGLPGKINELAELHLNGELIFSTKKNQSFSNLFSSNLFWMGLAAVGALLCIALLPYWVKPSHSDNIENTELQTIEIMPVQRKDIEISELSIPKLKAEDDEIPIPSQESPVVLKPLPSSDAVLSVTEKNTTVETSKPPESTRVEPSVVEQKSVTIETKTKSDDSPVTVIPTKNSVKKKTNKAIKSVKQNWTLQLIGAKDEKKIRAFYARYDLKNKAKIVKTTYQGQSWYIIVYGDFISRQEAMLSIRKLPKAIQDLNPWPRTHQSIQR